MTTARQRICLAAAPVVCSFDVPPGDYEIQLALGSRTAPAATGIQVEARRTVLAPVTTRAGQIVTESVTVNVRTPERMPDGQEGPGTPGLQVYLTGAAPALAGIGVSALPRIQHGELAIRSNAVRHGQPPHPAR
jgi:hypothetical protein